MKINSVSLALGAIGTFIIVLAVLLMLSPYEAGLFPFWVTQYIFPCLIFLSGLGLFLRWGIARLAIVLYLSYVALRGAWDTIYVIGACLIRVFVTHQTVPGWVFRNIGIKIFVLVILVACIYFLTRPYVKGRFKTKSLS